jgi:hypothetical protein
MGNFAQKDTKVVPNCRVLVETSITWWDFLRNISKEWMHISKKIADKQLKIP